MRGISVRTADVLDAQSGRFHIGPPVAGRRPPPTGPVVRCLSLIVLLVAIAAPLTARVNQWTRNGPPGAHILDLHVPPASPDSVFALTLSGALFRALTGEVPSWTAVSRVPVRHESFMSSNPEDPGIVYVLTPEQASARLLRSGNGGVSWTETALAIGGASNLQFATAQVGFIASADGLFVTRNGGATWTRTGPPGVNSLEVARDGKVYIIADETGSAGGTGLHVSSDLGETWRLLKGNTARIVVSVSGRTLYTLRDRLGPDIERSRDGGVTWQKLSRLPSDQGLLQVLAATDDRIFAGGGLFTFDEAGRWSRDAELRGGHLPLAASVAPSGLFFIGTDGGVFVSSGDEWRFTAAGMMEGATWSLAAGAANEVYATTTAALFASEDGAESWREVAVVSPLHSIAVADDVIYVASDSGIRKSMDKGHTWTVVSPRRAYWFGTSASANGTLYASFEQGLARSRDGGITWTSAAPLPLNADLAMVDPDDSERIYATRHDGFDGEGFQHVYGSINGGESWTLIFSNESTGMSLTAVAARGPVVQLALSAPPGWPTAFPPGIITTLDGGLTWYHSMPGHDPVMALAIDPVRSWRSYAGTVSGRVYRNDFGSGWTPIGDGLPSINGFAFSRDGRRIHARSESGVFTYEVAPAGRFERLPDDPERLPRLINQLLGTQDSTLNANGILIPAAGTVQGAGGTTFRTDVTLANARPTAQDVLLFWLPQGNTAGASVPAFRLTLSALSDDDSGAMTLSDLTDDLELSGLGSLFILGVDSEGNVDADADLDGFARIRSLSECGGWVSQSLAAVPADALGSSRRSRILGLRHDTSTRTNVGIVNLGASARTFTVNAIGADARQQFSVALPPFSSALSQIPNGSYGALNLIVSTPDESAPWISFGSSVDNESGDAWSVVGRRLDTP